MEVACRMPTELPEVLDINKESDSTRAPHGQSDFGPACLMALRMIEKGVRIVEVYFGGGQPWDSHDDILVHAKIILLVLGRRQTPADQSLYALPSPLGAVPFGPPGRILSVYQYCLISHRA